MKVLLLFFLLPLQIFAQDISGVWTGSLYNDTTKQFIKYELAISEYNGKLNGYSHTIFIIDSVENVGVKSIKIKRSGEDFFVEDDKLVYNNYTAPPAKGVKTYSNLVLSQNDTAWVLSGSWNTNQTKIYKKLTGNIFLQKKKDVQKTLIIPKLEKLGLAKSLSFPTSSPPQKNLVVLNNPTLISAKLNDEFKVDSENIVLNKKEKVDLKNNRPEEKMKINQPESSKANDRIADKTISNKIPSSITKTPAPKNEAKNGLSLKSQNNKIENPVKLEEKVVGSVLSKEDGVAISKIVNEKPAIEMPVKKDDVVSAKAEIQLPEKQQIKPKKIDAGALGTDINTLKIVPQAAAGIATRKIETVKSVEIKQDSLLLTLYDNGEIDGDTVSVLLNGNIIMPKQGLTARGISKTIYFTPEMGDSIKLILYAENLGSIPPNTGLLVIHDGEDIFEIRFAGDLQKNSAIILKRKKKQ